MGEAVSLRGSAELKSERGLESGRDVVSWRVSGIEILLTGCAWHVS